jgi:hypothetical protein
MIHDYERNARLINDRVTATRSRFDLRAPRRLFLLDRKRHGFDREERFVFCNKDKLHAFTERLARICQRLNPANDGASRKDYAKNSLSA